jgi:hypothetical protein
MTMLLGGFWHGAKWTFLIWGGLHGGVQVIETLWRKASLPAPAQAARDHHHLPYRDARLDLLPRRQLRRRRSPSSAESSVATGSNGMTTPLLFGADAARHGLSLHPAAELPRRESRSGCGACCPLLGC